ncbi:MAG: hypothetical protein Q9167_007857 [Letrouitia subvulpina]
MDPFAAIGLASSIVQFLDFSSKLITGTFELYRSANGATSINNTLEAISRDLVQLCTVLTPDSPGVNTNIKTKSEASLLPLLDSCRNLGKEFLITLDDLKVQGHWRRWQSIRQALRSIWKADDIQRYEKQLESYRSQIVIRLLAMLTERQEKIFEHQSGLYERLVSVGDALDRLSASHQRLELDFNSAFMHLRDSIEHAAKSANLAPQNGNLQLPEELADWLLELKYEASSLHKSVHIIESLEFPQLYEREDNIKEAHPSTYKWLFEEPSSSSCLRPRSNILDWLRNGHGTYYISGKAGSGKSTLMKFFYNHKQTKSALESWAGTRKLMVASFYFWNAGTTMQKNQQGLFQSLLYHVFKQYPALIPSLCPDRWQQSPNIKSSWKQKEILEAFAKLRWQNLENVRFCFFIDGLDEYSGDHRDIIEIISNITATQAIKVCFSSRPWIVFENYFGNNGGLKMRLQDLTREDMEQFVKDRLTDGAYFKKIGIHDIAYKSLVSEIVSRSDGVFLWVYLIVLSLRRGRTNSDTVVELQQRLRELPTELETFFQHILDSGDVFYRQQAARLYLIRLIAQDPLSAVDVSCFAEDKMDFAIDFTRTTRTRVLARCQDLLEWNKKGHLQFLHRTVADFLKTRDVQNQLELRAGDAFNADLFICNSKLLQIRLAASYYKITYFDLQQCHFHLDTFWKHANRLELSGQLDYRLFPPLDLAVWHLSAGVKRFSSSKNITFDPGHLEGWYIDRAAKEGIWGILSHAIGKTVAIIRKGGDVTQKLPLEVALRYAEYDQQKQVRLLLEHGADPNEKCEPDISIWQSYLCNLPNSDAPFGAWGNDYSIIEILLLNGADPNVGGDPAFFRRQLLAANAALEKVNEMEKLRMTLTP